MTIEQDLASGIELFARALRAIAESEHQRRCARLEREIKRDLDYGRE